MKDKNIVKKSVFIIGLLLIFIACIWFINKGMQIPDNANGFGSQSVEVSSTANDKNEVLWMIIHL